MLPSLIRRSGLASRLPSKLFLRRRVRVAIVGNSSVGKDSLIHYLVHGTARPSSGASADGSARTVSKNLNEKGVISFEFLKAEPKSVKTVVDNGAEMAVVVYDASSSQSLESMRNAVRELTVHPLIAKRVVIVGTKADLPSAPNAIEAKQFAQTVEIPHIRVDSYQGSNISSLWAKLSEIAPSTSSSATATATSSNGSGSAATAAPSHMTADQLRAYWDKFSAKFDSDIAPTLATSQSGLFSRFAGQAKTAVEVGCGSGILAQLALSVMHPDAKLYALDLSPEMIKLASARLSHAGDRVSLSVGNSESLPFEADAFDRYWANYVLHLTPEPKKMLQEAYRVTKPGGFAAFAVWGRREHSAQFTLPMAVMTELNLPHDKPATRSSFHLENKESTRQMILEAGFSSAVAWYSFVPLDVHDGDEYLVRVVDTPTFKPLLSKLSDEQTQLFRSTLKAKVASMLGLGEPIGHEALIVVAKK